MYNSSIFRDNASDETISLKFVQRHVSYCSTAHRFQPAFKIVFKTIAASNCKITYNLRLYYFLSKDKLMQLELSK